MSEGPTPIRRRRVHPAGNRILHEAVAETERAVRFRYYGWILWIPRSALSRVGEEYSAPLWALETAKAHDSALRFGSDDEARDHADDLIARATITRRSIVKAPAADP